MIQDSKSSVVAVGCACEIHDHLAVSVTLNHMIKTARANVLPSGEFHRTSIKNHLIEMFRRQSKKRLY